MTFREAVRSVLRRYAVFSGRARRSEFWYWYLALVIAAFAIGFLSEVSYDVALVLSVVFLLGVAVPTLAVAARRLHDIGASAWWLLLALLPVAGGLVLLVLYLFDSKPGTNAYGPNPKAVVEA
ncbi:DUF805 domain-containing protein [Marmoricola sp. RAF53]|uniref:DUF805 domain-containing protein n=1 Tax=Marmoricola sp. RAF53 TaxID=3233059 RepID=UPI003F9C12DC